MQRPRDLDDYNQCIKILDSRILIFCVECDAWRSTKMKTVAYVEFLHTGLGKIRIVGESVKLYCGVCEADIDYLLPGGSKRDRVIKQLTHIYALLNNSQVINPEA